MPCMMGQEGAFVERSYSLQQFIRWGLGSYPSSAAAATTKANTVEQGGWNKAGRFWANMRRGSLGCITTTWEEEQLRVASGDCGAVQGRLKAGPTSSCDEDPTMGATNSAATLFLFRGRTAATLLVGALVAAAIYSVYSSRCKPSRPRPRPQRDDDNDGGRVENGEETGVGDKAGADEDKTPERTGARGGGGGGGGGDGDVGGGGNGGEEYSGHEAGDRAEGGEGECPPTSSGSVDPARNSSPSPENDRERAGSVEDAEDRQGENGVPASKGGDNSQGARGVSAAGAGGDQRGDASARSGGKEDQKRDEARAGGSPNRDQNGSALSREPSLSSSGSSSTEELLAEADSLIADSEKASARRTPGRSRRARATAGRSRARFDSTGEPDLTTTSGKKTPSPSRPSDNHRRKRARVYREVSGAEVDALVRLTNRALQRDPAALIEIAEDPSIQKSGEDELSPLKY